MTGQIASISEKSSLDYIWIALSILFRATGSALAKQAGLFSAGRELVMIAANPWYLAELVAFALQACCWIMALRRFSLSFAYPFISLVFAVNLIVAHMIFRESVRANQVLGILIIIGGVILAARGAKP